MRILGLDVGTKNVGMAISDPFGYTAQSLPTIRRKNHLEQELQTISAVLKEKQVETIVIGFPKNMNGTEGASCEMAKEYADYIREKTDVPIVFWDERLTSKMAENAMIQGDVRRNKRKEAVDSLAAILILQNYLDYLQNQKNKI